MMNFESRAGRILKLAMNDADSIDIIEYDLDELDDTDTSKNIQDAQIIFIQPLTEGESPEPNDDEDTAPNEVETMLENVQEAPRRRRGRKAQKSKWFSNKNSKNREQGRGHFGRKDSEKWLYNITKPSRSLKQRCNCRNSLLGTSKLKCSLISDDQRLNIFNEFWGMTWNEKKIYIRLLMLRQDVKRSRNRLNPASSRRSCSYIYFLQFKSDSGELQRIRVCKKMFAITLGINERLTNFWVQGSSAPQIAVEANQAGEENCQTGTRAEQRKLRCENMMSFFESLPKMESHYCRASTKKIYLEPNFNSISEIYELYKNNWCLETHIEPCSKTIFYEQFNDNNYSIFPRKKDECNTCVAYQTKNVSIEDYLLHRKKKEEARQEKANDKESNNVVLTMDLQSVLLSPKSNVSAAYYKTKLIVHNFTLYDLKTKAGYCYLWNECEGGLSANEFSSIICHHLEENVIPTLRSDQKIILYSDGCTSQNRNVTLSKALLNLAVIHKIEIQQKYLEKGHTQMECDSMHSTIETAIGKRNINVPADYVEYCKIARRKDPYKVKYLSHNFFKSFTDLNYFKSIRPAGRSTGDANVTDIRAIRYRSDLNMDYKLAHTDPWTIMCMRISQSIEPCSLKDLPKLHNAPIKIKNEKYKHLQDLKKTIEPDYHRFYDDLPHWD